MMLRLARPKETSNVCWQARTTDDRPTNPRRREHAATDVPLLSDLILASHVGHCLVSHCSPVLFKRDRFDDRRSLPGGREVTWPDPPQRGLSSPSTRCSNFCSGSTRFCAS